MEHVFADCFVLFDKRPRRITEPAKLAAVVGNGQQLLDGLQCAEDPCPSLQNLFGKTAPASQAMACYDRHRRALEEPLCQARTVKP